MTAQEAKTKPAAENSVPAESQDFSTTAQTKKKTQTEKKKRKKGTASRQVSSGRAYIKATYNNTIVTFTDQQGNVLAWSSAGQCGFKGPKKSTPYAASVITKNACERVKKYGLKEVAVMVKGVGSGREAAVRALNANGMIVAEIKDITPIPHNGCRAPKPRRV